MPRKQSPNLTEAELKLMQVLWARGSGTVSDVVEALPKKIPLAYSTVLTTLRILENKGHVRHTKEGRAFIYHPIMGREQARENAVTHLVRSFFGNSRELLVLNLLDAKRVDPAELKRLRKLIEEQPHEHLGGSIGQWVDFGTLMTFLIALILQIGPKRWLNAATRYLIWSILLITVAVMPFLFLRRERPPIAIVEQIENLPARNPAAPTSTKAPLTASPTALKPGRPVWFPLAKSGDRWMEGILVSWVGIAFLMLLRVGVSIVSLNERKARAVAPPTSLAARLESWLARCGTTRTVRLACSREIGTPLAAGPWRPAILIPVCLLDQLSEDEWDQVGLHEAAHLARWDDVALVVQRVMEAVFFFHPAILWISRRMDLEREIACDDFVLAATGRARSYAACLTRIAELGDGVGSSAIAPAVLQQGSHLTRRVHALLDQTRNAGTRLLGDRLTSFVFLFVALTWLGWRTPLVVAFAAPQAPPRQVPPPRRPAPANALENTDAPVSLCLVLDTSGSMSDKAIQSNRAALPLAQASRPDDEICIVTFADESFLDQPFTNDAQKVNAALSKSEARGGSAVRSAIDMTIDYMKSNGTRVKKILVLVTDGADTSSAETQDQLLRKIKESGIHIYAIGLLNQDAREAEQAKRSLRDIAEASGGRDFYAGDFPDAEKAIGQIVSLIHNP